MAQFPRKHGSIRLSPASLRTLGIRMADIGDNHKLPGFRIEFSTTGKGLRVKIYNDKGTCVNDETFTDATWVPQQ